jgi:hypothetical protein
LATAKGYKFFLELFHVEINQFFAAGAYTILGCISSQFKARNVLRFRERVEK